MRSSTLARLALGVAALAAIFAPTTASAKNIKVTTTIQAAVNAASPGDTVVVPPGTYYEGVLVTTSGLTIKGSNAAVLDASGHPYGIDVESAAPGDPPVFPGCPDLSIHGFTLDGLRSRTPTTPAYSCAASTASA